MQNRLYIPLILLAVIFSGCKSSEKKETERIVKVNAIQCGSHSSNSSHTYSGTLEEAYSATLSFATSGRVTSVYVKEGQRVAEGQLLARVDRSQAESAYQAAKATLDKAQDGYDRAKQVYEKGSLPDIKWTEIQSQLSQAQSVADMAKKNLEDCDLRAPSNGTISDRTIEAGTSVTAFQPVMKLIGLDGMYVKTSIPEDDIQQITLGTRAIVTVSALDNRQFEAVVEERNPTADPITHSYTIRLRLRHSVRELLPGMVCKVALETPATSKEETNSKGVEVPNRAVQIDNSGHRYVWTIVDGKAQQKRVTITDLTANGVLISEGITSDDIIVVDGMLKLSSGTKVDYRIVGSN